MFAQELRACQLIGPDMPDDTALLTPLTELGTCLPVIGVAGCWSSCRDIDAICLRGQARATLSDSNGLPGAALLMVGIAENMGIVRPGMFWT